MRTGHLQLKPVMTQRGDSPPGNVIPEKPDSFSSGAIIVCLTILGSLGTIALIAILKQKISLLRKNIYQAFMILISTLESALSPPDLEAFAL